MSTLVHSRLEAGESPAGSRIDSERPLSVADTGAGLLVYRVETEYRRHLDRRVTVARELVGFSDVSDWSVIRDALRARGHGVGATTHLPEIPLSELPEPRA
ncbi:hypothetical protein C5C07_20045 [Haloferax sp. Atlit-4N]|uniref:hypothetical protein n=1 Tax=Haloferax sp. Atlit-4N TaxID=2077206 RepID=UPI000E2641ED|nr:hypothetical protein [Haloferax sp. Atlit-4N]RDZ49825.1 hypothetical protein C5C07_20045 [Haloferax sp. Atlit-4N]